jgi:nitrite reductase/ring-hydroxylating ferredoxin subunit
MIELGEHDVGHIDQFAEGAHRVVVVDGRQIGVFNIGGAFHALPNVCPHQTGPLCEARKLIGSFRAVAETGWRKEWVHDGEVIACPWHGLEYHVPTGQSLAFPHIKLRRYAVRIDDGRILIRVGAPRRPARAR